MKKIASAVIVLCALLVCMAITFNSCAQLNYTGQSYRFATPAGGLGASVDTTTFAPKPPGTIVWGNNKIHYYVGLDGFFHLLGGSSTGLIAGLTSPRIPFASSPTSLSDNAGFSFSGGSVNVPNLTDAGLTTTRIPFASTGGLLINSANLSYTSPTGLLVQAASTINDVAEFLSNAGGCSLCLREGKAQFSGGTGGREIDIFSGSQMLIQNITNTTTQDFVVSGGTGIPANVNGDNIVISGGTGLAANNGNGGNASILGGNASATNGNAGSVKINVGSKQGTGTNAPVQIAGGNSVGVGISQISQGFITPSATLHLSAGSATAGTAPLKLTSGPLLTAAEAGTIEFLTDNIYYTRTTGPARLAVLSAATGAITTGSIPFAASTTPGQNTYSSALTFATNVLTVGTTTGAIVAPHLSGSSATPGIAAGTGAGTGPTVSVTRATDLAGTINVTTGTAPAVSAAIVTLTLASFGTIPTAVISPGNATTAALGTANIFPSMTTTTLVLNSNTVALTASTAYVWTYHIIQ